MSLEEIFELVRVGLETLLAAKTVAEWWEARRGRTGRGGIDLSTAEWRKSTFGAANGCVEVAFLGGQVAVRDSNATNGPVLTFPPVEWQAFLDGIVDGEFELP